MIRQTLSIALIAGSLAIGGAQAAEPEVSSKQGLIGMGGGAVVGALVGGPIGLGVGAILGGIIGDSAHAHDELEAQQLAHRNQIEIVLSQLADSRRQNGSLQAERQRLNQQLAERPEPRETTLDGSLALDVLFRTGSDRLEPAARAQLAELGAAIKAAPGLRIRLRGHADARGSEQANLKLSAQRVDAVQQALAAAGVAPGQMEASPLGEAQARAAAGDVDGLALDRRVVVQLELQPPQAEQRTVSLKL